MLSYEQDTELEILDFVNKARDLILMAFVIKWYKFQSNIVSSVDYLNTLNQFILCALSRFTKKKCNELLYIICKQIILELCLHNNESLSLISRDFYHFKFLVNHSNCTIKPFYTLKIKYRNILFLKRV